MAARGKVYGWVTMAAGRLTSDHRQVRVIVAAASWAEADRLATAAGLGKSHRDYRSITGNRQELDTALAAPGVVFWRGLDDRGEFTRAEAAS